jgi:hypothetical protein
MLLNSLGLALHGISLGAAPSTCSLFGYLDPGTGSFALQLLIAGMFSSLYAVKHYWRQIKGAVLRTARNDA